MQSRQVAAEIIIPTVLSTAATLLAGRSTSDDVATDAASATTDAQRAP